MKKEEYINKYEKQTCFLEVYQLISTSHNSAIMLTEDRAESDLGQGHCGTISHGSFS